jgi:hypothetical protein
MSTPSKDQLQQKADRMAEIRGDRREAGFTEVTCWVPKEEARGFRDYAWALVEAVDRVFPHRAREGQRRRQRRSRK